MRPPESMQRFQGMAEDELRLALAERTEPLYRMMEYQLGWIDDQGSASPGPVAPRVRATLCLALCDALGGDPAAAAPAAAAVELIHLFSQVHEDIQDGSPNRGNRPTVWWVWGPAQAINAGDGLHALARLSLFRMAERGAPPERVLEATRVLDQACLQLFEGQHMALRFQEQINVTQEAYSRMAERRAGALPGCAAELAAIAASASVGAREACRRCGSRIGVAMQIRADIQGIWGGGQGGNPSADILNKRKSLPIVHAMEVAPPKVKRELGTLYMQRVLEASDAPRVVELLDGVGARQFCEERAERALEEALGALSDTPMPDHARDGLAVMAGFAASVGLTA